MEGGDQGEGQRGQDLINCDDDGLHGLAHFSVELVESGLLNFRKE